ncbi:MAG: hypothetical protein JO170_04870 [Verrucomicrobia bacterium]|nr:hypothetical protein [Verrucomicrobiota bacterium]
MTESRKALWSAMRSLEEKAFLMRHMAAHFSEHDRQAAAEQLLKKAKGAEQRSESIRKIVMTERDVFSGLL